MYYLHAQIDSLKRKNNIYISIMKIYFLNLLNVYIQVQLAEENAMCRRSAKKRFPTS